MTLVATDLNLIQSKIRDIADFPKPGIIFKDITPLLQDKSAFQKTIHFMESQVNDLSFDAIVGIESRGFLFGPSLAYKMHKSFVPVRKKGKLPGKTQCVSYKLEYGEAEIEVHEDAIVAGHQVVIVDDVLATGGTALAACQLIEKLGGKVAALVFLGEISALKGRAKISQYPIFSLLQF